MENGDAAASWKDPDSCLWIMAEMQGKVANGDLPATPGSAAFLPTIYPRNQGHLRNGERFLSPESE